ncbi:MAG: hypothetical protein U0871_14800 [Gemmataceae bacterium]
MTTSAAPPPLELVPPPDPAAVYRLGLAGLAAAGLAAALGAVADLALGGGPAVLSTARLLLTAAGAVIAGVAVAQRPGLWKAWAILAGVTILAAVVAVPPHWDSGRLLARMLSLVTVAGTVLVALPVVPRLSLLTAAVLFHFGGILTATTWPEPAPWLTVQAANRVYMPYLTAIYMRNAYHFYSPEPGPASLLHILVKYELDQTDPATGKKKVVREWLVLPDRMAHMKDPLGLSYYRRLSITEAVSRAIADAYAPDSFNKLDAWRNRTQVHQVGFHRQTDDGKTELVVIPIAPDEVEPARAQYRIPYPEVSRYLLPAYAKHLAVELSAPGRRVVGVQIYRLEHRIVQPPAFVGAPPFNKPMDPYDPLTYRPFYLGEYAPDGTLVNPKDPLLYWLVPIVPKPGGPSPTDPEQRAFDDYLSKHAGYQVNWRRP